MSALGRIRRSRGATLAMLAIGTAALGVALILSPDLFWEEIGLALVFVDLGVFIVIGGVWSLVAHLHDAAARGSVLSLLFLPATLLRSIIGFGVIAFGLVILLVALLVH